MSLTYVTRTCGAAANTATVAIRVNSVKVIKQSLNRNKQSAQLGTTAYFKTEKNPRNQIKADLIVIHLVQTIQEKFEQNTTSEDLFESPNITTSEKKLSFEHSNCERMLMSRAGFVNRKH